MRQVKSTGLAGALRSHQLWFSSWGAVAASRRSLGTAVFNGMVAASILVPLFAPMFYAVVQRIREKVKGTPAAAATVTQEGVNG